MPASLVIAHFFVLLLATSTSFLLLAAAERRFEPSAGPTIPATAASSRCYALSFVAADSLSVAWVPLRSPICLSPSPATDPEAVGWYTAALPAPDSSQDRYARYSAPARWRPVGTDSLDVAVPSWPVGVWLRIPHTDDVAIGRLIAIGDASFVLPFKGRLYTINWPPVYRVRAALIKPRTLGARRRS